MPSLSRYFDHTMQRIGTQIMEMLCYWNSLSHFIQERSKLPAQLAASLICKICLAPRSTWSWKSSSTWKPSRHHPVASTADSRRAKRGLWRWVFIVAGLSTSCVQHCWLQPSSCSRQDDRRAIKAVREEETASNKAALASSASSSLKIC